MEEFGTILQVYNKYNKKFGKETKDETKEMLLSEKFIYTFVVYSSFRRRVLGPSEMSSERMNMLSVIGVREKCSLKTLCEILGIKHSAGSITVDKMVQQGLVSRTTNSQDRRQILLSITPKGKAEVEKCYITQARIINERFRSLSGEEVESMNNAFDTIARILKKDLPPI